LKDITAPLKGEINQLPYELPSELKAALGAFIVYYTTTGAITKGWLMSPRMMFISGDILKYHKEGGT
jgi:hypothetical protein